MMKMFKASVLVFLLGMLVVGGRVLAQEGEGVSPTPAVTGEIEDVTEEIKQKVQERLTKAAKQKKAYVGILADIADATLKIETRDGVKMAATDDTTVFLRSKKGVQQKIEISELPVEEQIIAMGYLGNENGQVLETKRVISCPVPEADARLVKMGQVADLVRDGDFTLVGVSGESYQVEVSRGTEYTVFGEEEVEEFEEDLEEGMKVIVVGVADKKDETVLVVSLVHVVSGIEEEEVEVSPTPSEEE